MLQELIVTVNIVRNMLCGNEAVKVGLCHLFHNLITNVRVFLLYSTHIVLTMQAVALLLQCSFHWLGVQHGAVCHCWLGVQHGAVCHYWLGAVCHCWLGMQFAIAGWEHNAVCHCWLGAQRSLPLLAGSSAQFAIADSTVFWAKQCGQDLLPPSWGRPLEQGWPTNERKGKNWHVVCSLKRAKHRKALA